MLNLLEKELHKHKVFSTSLPNIVEQLAGTITAKIPHRMKLTLAVHELVVFTTQFRRNLLHWNKSSIPTNAISFCLAKSGANKDSSVKAIKKCFDPSYKKIQDLQVTKNEELAQKTALENGDDNPERWSTYKEYIKPLNPLVVAPSTVEGFIQYLNDIDELGVSSGNMFSGEFGSELASNSSMVDNIRLLSEIYDEGTKEVKVLKDRTNQSKEIKNLPVSALMISSYDNILFDDNIKRKFKTEFTTKLARRTFFNFPSEKVEKPVYDTVAELLKEERETELVAVQNREVAIQEISEVCDYQLKQVGKHIEVDDAVVDLFLLYKRYNEEKADTMEYQLQISKLSRQHLQWKALKLSGVFACMRCSDIVEAIDYKQAVTYTELLHNDIILFEKELSKEPYEMFVDYVQAYIGNEPDIFVDSNTLKKLGYLTGTGTLSNKLHELATMSSTYDKGGVYTAKKDGVFCRRLVKQSSVWVSYVEVPHSKEDRKNKCSKGYVYEDYKFEDLADMLTQDLAYTPFKFKNGIRNADNLEGTTNWVALDVDISVLDDEDVHFMLSDINHHIARTSDPDNPNKFRVLVELDNVVDVPYDEWVHFIQSIAEELALDVDMLPKSQIFYSFEGRKVLSVTDGEPIKVKEHVAKASDRASKGKPKALTKAVKSSLLGNRRETFSQAYEAKDGEGSRKLIWAAKYARELGADKEEILDIVTEINDFWTFPMDSARFNTTIIKQIESW